MNLFVAVFHAIFNVSCQYRIKLQKKGLSVSVGPDEDFEP
jgi:hypothetical protein